MTRASALATRLLAVVVALIAVSVAQAQEDPKKPAKPSSDDEPF